MRHLFAGGRGDEQQPEGGAGAEARGDEAGGEEDLDAVFAAARDEGGRGVGEAGGDGVVVAPGEAVAGPVELRAVGGERGAGEGEGLGADMEGEVAGEAAGGVKGGATGLLKKPKKQRQSCRTVFTMCLFGGVQRPSICSAPLIIHIGS